MSKQDILDRAYLNKPCSSEWSLMEGDDRVRFCAECSKQVHNLSLMTRKQAQDLLANAGGDLCAKFERNDRGEIVTIDQIMRSPVFGMRLPRFASATVATMLGVGMTVPANVRPSCTVVSRSNQPVQVRSEKTEINDGQSAVEGTVVDSTKSVVGAATVKIIDEKSHKEHIATTSDEGQYRVQRLEPGTYMIIITSPGFVQYRKTGIELRTKTEMRLNVTLQAGSVGGVALRPVVNQSRSVAAVLSSPIRAIRKALTNRS